MQKNILLLFGGGGSEHEVSRVSSRYYLEQLTSINQNLESHKQFNILTVEVLSKNDWKLESEQNQVKSQCHINENGELEFSNQKLKIDYCVPCFHGPPGETGEIQVFLDLVGIPYFGNDYEASLLCFNKIQTKLLCESRKIPTVPFDYVQNANQESLKLAEELFDKYSGLFIKSSHQGSSVGCHLVKNKTDLEKALKDSLSLSPFALLEMPVKARELEVSVYQIDEQTFISDPGEIICHEDFYDYEEKYSESSSADILDKADLPKNIAEQIKSYAKQAAEIFRIKDIVRVDFFLVDDQIYLNELNTFPGMTPISLFPRMISTQGREFKEVLQSSIKKYCF